MGTITLAVFSIALALLLAHEMDAVRKQEWKMFIGLKAMDDEKAYQVFLLLHIPLYAALLLLLFSAFSQIGYYIVDIFLIGHMFLHWAFEKHPANRLNGTASKLLINMAGLLALVHIVAIAAT